MSKKILFPTDFSKAAKNAFIYALKLAESIDAEIITLHVYQLPQANFVNAATYLHEIYDVTELSKFENYSHQVPALRNIADENNLAHIKISHVLISGNLIDEIKKITENENFDFVVMGTKGGSSMKETFFGTVATKVMNDVKATVLIIPEQCQYVPINNMLMLTEYKIEDTEAFKKVVSLADTFNAQVACLHITSSKNSERNDAKKYWEELIAPKQIAFYSNEGDDVEGIILEFINTHQINLVAMQVYHKNFFEKMFQSSISKKLAFHINVPILALHQ